ncbi:MAG: M43 family zinc metalloprotease [Saprospiraceae bacterium]
MKQLFIIFTALLFLNCALAQNTSNPIKYVNVNIHFMLKNDGSGNFNEYWDGVRDSTKNGYFFAEKVIDKANYELSHNQKMFRKPFGIDSIDVLPVNVQYSLKGVYFDRDDKFQNDDFFSGWDILDKFGVNTKTEINIFSIAPERSGSGIAIQILSPEIKSPALATKVSYYNKYLISPEWSENYAASTINHEIGHLLGLNHTWNTDDDCEDTPMGFRKESGEWGQCWGYQTNDKYCNNWLNISNNIMDYNEHYPHAYTPCQINRIQIMLRTSASAFVEQIGGAPPVNIFLKVQKEYAPEAVIIEGSATSNEQSYRIEVINLKKNPKFPKWIRKTVWSSDWTAEPLSNLNLSNRTDFKKGNYYLIRTKVKSKEARVKSVENTFYIK